MIWGYPHLWKPPNDFSLWKWYCPKKHVITVSNNHTYPCTLDQVLPSGRENCVEVGGFMGFGINKWSPRSKLVPSRK